MDIYIHKGTNIKNAVKRNFFSNDIPVFRKILHMCEVEYERKMDLAARLGLKSRDLGR
jgi:hypothetical protein